MNSPPFQRNTKGFQVHSFVDYKSHEIGRFSHNVKVKI
jgi:hypothetical protein